MTRILFAVLIVLLAIPITGIPESADAQSAEVLDLYDFDGDGEITCYGDFEIEYPRTYTDEATDAMNRFPDELGHLNNDPEDDDTACDGQPGEATAPSPTPAPTRAVRGCPSGIVAEVSHAIVCSGGGGSGFADTFEDDDLVFVAKADGGSGISADIADVASGTGSTPAGGTFAPAFGIFQTTVTQSAADDAPRQLTTEQKARKLKAKQKRIRKAKRARQRAVERERQERLAEARDKR